MAKQKNSMELTPIMSLSILAIFALAVPIFSISRSSTEARRAQAKGQQEMLITGSPSPSPSSEMPKEAPVY